MLTKMKYHCNNKFIYINLFCTGGKIFFLPSSSFSLPLISSMYAVFLTSTNYCQRKQPLYLIFFSFSFGPGGTVDVALNHIIVLLEISMRWLVRGIR